MPPHPPAARRAVPIEDIASRENRWLKRFRSALRHIAKSEDGLIGIEGVHLVEEALRSGLEVAAVLVSASGERHLERLAAWIEPAAERGPARTRILRTSERLFASLADTESPQGVAALIRPRRAQLDDLLRGGTPLVVVLVGVQDPGNVGTVLRSAEAFGATGAAASSGTADPFGPKALRASAGSALRLPVLHGIGVSVLLAQLRIAGVRLLAASTSRGLSPPEADLRGPVALLVGNEGAGLPAEVERSADAQIRIPVAGTVESLNAAVAASVLLYEAARQRGES